MVTAFATGGLVLAGGLSVLTYELTRTYLLNQRQTSAVRQARANARLVRNLLRSPDPDLPRLLGSLETPANSQPVVFHDREWFSSSAVTGPDELPADLRRLVLDDRRPGRQRYDGRSSASLAVGVPLGGGDGYFEAFPLAELNRTLRTLADVLAAAAASTFAVSIGLGVWAARRVCGR